MSTDPTNETQVPDAATLQLAENDAQIGGPASTCAEPEAASQGVQMRGRKKRRVRFTSNMDVTLLKCVKFSSAHIAPHSQGQALYEQAVAMLISQCDLNDPSLQISWKTAYDRFNRLVSDRRQAARRNELRSGNVETVTDFEQELDSMIEEIDHYEEEKTRKRSEEAGRQNELQAAGEQIRQQALQRASTPQLATPEHVQNDGDDDGALIGSSSSSARKRFFDQSDDEEKEMIHRHAERREQREQKMIKIDEDRLSIERRRVEQDAETSNRNFNLQSQRFELDRRRLELDTQRHELDKQERAAQVEQSKQLTCLLSKLVDKLN